MQNIRRGSLGTKNLLAYSILLGFTLFACDRILGGRISGKLDELSGFKSGPKVPPESSRYRVINFTCDEATYQPTELVQQKISSYSFPGTEMYLEELFQATIETAKPEYPAFVTAFSSSHVEEGRGLIKHINKIRMEEMPRALFHVFDIGLSKAERDEIRESCNCTFMVFPFDKFPNHVRNLRAFAWKPIVMQMVIRHHPFIMWVDASTRFLESGLVYLVGKTKVDKVVVSNTRETLTMYTLIDTFEVLKEKPCLFRYAKVFDGSFIAINAGAFEIQYLMKPFVSCALFPRCMVPPNDVEKFFTCEHPHYFKCHRFDKSVLTILIYRLYHIQVQSHVINGELFFNKSKSVED